MAFKFVVFAAFVACASAGAIPAAPVAYSAGYDAPLAYESHAAPIAYEAHAAPVAIAAPVAKAVIAEDSYDPHPQYRYSYDVHDAITGDSKTQEEQRDGDAVRGSYSLLEADGTRRIVEYTADAHSGFNAVVRKEAGIHAAPVAVKTAVHAAPAVAAYAEPALAYKSHGEYY
ncbi:cuticular protein RR-2 family member 14 precursor [Nasonia vitripennis]|uniref:Uncharacterized protein n=1 Tax=Nasonia vitripennis TaxID=7425 RepID=A0A7M6UWH5_NASVI|nr:cuticular protein RR-2 family member 14 precursor [Nasonia vitripennis]